jgi:DNA-binding NarL/FixJ family response regulator
MKRVLIVDDHDELRGIVRRFLEASGGVEVVADTNTGHNTLELLDVYRPELLLLDLMMPQVSGFDLMKEIQRLKAAVKVIVLSVHVTPDYLQRAWQFGAAAYVLKDSATDDLLAAIEAAMRGERFISPSIKLLLGRLAQTG